MKQSDESAKLKKRFRDALAGVETEIARADHREDDLAGDLEDAHDRVNRAISDRVSRGVNTPDEFDEYRRLLGHRRHASIALGRIREERAKR